LKHLDRTSLEIYRAIVPLGTALTPEMVQATFGIYAERLEEEEPERYRIERDQAYGPDARHRLDIFAPAEPDEGPPRPVLLFVHGGGFVRGDKGGPEDPFYNNVGMWAVRRGLLGVTMIYRLAPGFQWPAGAEDVARALEWLTHNAATFGGDPRRIVVMGQSAGAVHVAGFLAGHHGRVVPQPAGAVLLSGQYDLTTLEHTSFETAYFGADRTRFAAQSSLEGLLKTPVPCLFTMAELDPPMFQQQAAQLMQAHLAAKGVLPRMLYLLGHNHISTVLQIGTPGDTLGRELSNFIVRCTAD
jgi:triacylglycerol lipase